MLLGVCKPFTKVLILVGVGFKVSFSTPQKLAFFLGFSKPVLFNIPKSIKIDIQSPTKLILESMDKELLGITVAAIRCLRKINIYKGTGIKYPDELIVLKEIKKK
ncbi:UNVERIFIED_CONTAM: hypothetical protein GTU68_026403 [Idotea baltica]|nr:hypothetical protein [Idotea baltica]